MPRPRKKGRRREIKKVPRSDATLPEFDRGAVPEGLVTRRTLRDMGLSPGDNEGPVAILRCRLCATRPQWSCRHPTRGFLLRVDLARPKRVPTLAQELALDRAMAARSTCSRCSRRYYFCLKWAILHRMQHSPWTTRAAVAGREPRYTCHGAA
ncbi:RRQRL motif-containing zinc-binding protein, partial [Streptomyces sp. NPDC014623]|uniref:RRQRL motif-containing zinc-binding protein n=1 Tax=Streptomyces sp. NPDC014623 TaxID=3364875 RepID=UPI0036FDFC21